MCHPAVTRQALRAGILMMLILLVMSCGGGPAKEEAGARKLPEAIEVKCFPAGEYVSDEFRPAMSFRLGKGWCNWVEAHPAPGPGEGQEVRNNLVLFYNTPEGKGVGVLDFIVDPKVYKMVSSYEAKLEPTPKDMVAWLQQNPYLDTEKPEPATVGGAKGVRLDAVPSPVPNDYLACGEPCLPLFENAKHPGLFFALEYAADGPGAYRPGQPTYKTRLIVLDDVAGETVTIGLTATEPKFDEFLLKGQKVLDTVEWKGT
jgi:hypothetical protein